MVDQSKPGAANAPTLEAVRSARKALGDRVDTTPVWRWRSPALDALLGEDSEVWLKLELFQRGGSFKTRGALLHVLAMTEDERRRGVTAVSAGNHAIAVANAARSAGTSAKVVMIKTANPGRVETCRRLGAELVIAENAHVAFEMVARIEREEGRLFIHPFEGERCVLGTATVGLELMEQVENGLDAVIIPIGGGGLAAGIASAVKQRAPECRVYGIEPRGADTMHRSFEAGEPRSIQAVRTIADSLGAPHAAPYTFGLCRRFVDELALLDDDEIRDAMALLFEEMKIVAEPAAAASTAALVGPLREKLRGKRVGLIVCGSNIDLATFAEQASAAR